MSAQGPEEASAFGQQVQPEAFGSPPSPAQAQQQRALWPGVAPGSPPAGRPSTPQGDPPPFLAGVPGPARFGQPGQAPWSPYTPTHPTPLDLSFAAPPQALPATPGLTFAQRPQGGGQGAAAQPFVFHGKRAGELPSYVAGIGDAAERGGGAQGRGSAALPARRLAKKAKAAAAAAAARPAKKRVATPSSSISMKEMKKIRELASELAIAKSGLTPASVTGRIVRSRATPGALSQLHPALCKSLARLDICSIWGSLYLTRHNSYI